MRSRHTLVCRDTIYAHHLRRVAAQAIAWLFIATDAKKMAIIEPVRADAVILH